MAKLPNDSICHYYSDDGITINVDFTPLVKCCDCITHDGETRSMRQWCVEKGINYYTAKYRWKLGVRDFDELFSPEPRKKELHVPDWAIEWLRMTHRARAGQSNEWQIACELIGLPVGRAKELKKAMEGRL